MKHMEHVSPKGLLHSFKNDFYLFLKSFRFPLQHLTFWESKKRSEPPVPDLQAELASLLEKKQKLNQQIEKVQKQLELLQLALKENENPAIQYKLLEEGRRYTLEIQNIELQINRLRRLMKESKETKPHQSSAPVP
ncbi:MAG: hypothetical protein NZ480_00665 [Bdellovibrionaceae bacterium]|nr:hypothetical protein [Pseudobdellovibrionaceae bacterium]MDW8190987.1 hypothetical protein [Pseudobdellovibrionaceae bacterium]